MHHVKINLSTVVAGRRPGIEEVDGAVWLKIITHVLGTICYTNGAN